MKMKKKVLSLLTALLLVATLFTTAFAADSPVSCVTDISGILTYDEWEALETRAQDISQRTNCGVYIVILDDYTNYGEGDVYDVASQIFKNADNGFGVGTDRSGILLLLSMNERNWAMFVNGENAKYAFDNYGQTALEDAFLSDFGENDWYGGFSGYLDGCDEYLTLAASGKPVRKSVFMSIIVVVGISCGISLIVCLSLKGKMKTVHRKVEAKTYIASGGLCLTDSYDRYTHTTQTSRYIEKSTSGESGGNGSGRSGQF